MLPCACMPLPSHSPRDQLTEDEVFQYVLGVMDSGEAALVAERLRGSANIRAQVTAVRHLLGTFVTESDEMNGNTDAAESPGS